MSFYTNLDVAQRAARGEKQSISSIERALNGLHDPANKELVAKANADLVAKAITPGISHVDATIANMSVQYRNEEYIGLRLMPVIPVANKSGTYFVYDKRARMAYPDDAIGARGSLNEIVESRNPATFRTSGYGYKEFLDQSELSNADAPLNDMLDATVGLLEALAFREEKRIASILTTASTFGANTAALASGARWDVAGGNPINDILNARNSIWNGRGPGKVVAFMSLSVWTAMQQNAKLQETFKYTRDGLLQPTQWATYFGIDELLIGGARQDTANEGQAASYGRIWSDVFGIVRVATAQSVRNASFGNTLRFGGIDTAQVFDAITGAKGGWVAKASVEESHVVVAPDTGFLLTTVIG
jgi:hypothetical protein